MEEAARNQVLTFSLMVMVNELEPGTRDFIWRYIINIPTYS